MQNFIKKSLITLLIFLNSLSVLIGQSERIPSDNKIAIASRIFSPPEIDGYINDSVWFNAIPVTDFLQEEPLPSSLPSFKTMTNSLLDSIISSIL